MRRHGFARVPLIRAPGSADHAGIRAVSPMSAVLGALLFGQALLATPVLAADSRPTLARRIDPVLRQEIRTFRQNPGYAPSRAFNPAVVAEDRADSGEDLEGRRTPPHGDADVVRDGGSAPRLACWVQFADGARAPVSEYAMRAVGGGLHTAQLTLAEVDALLAHPDLLRIEVAQRARTSLDVSLQECAVPRVHDGSGTDLGAPPIYRGYAGTGIVIGVVDTGVDLEHLDFQAGGTTRVAWVWDQTSATVIPPAGFGYGNEWTHSQVDSGTAMQIDADGHGTHVLGTAAGNGRATGNGEPAYRYVGVAPEATIVVVKTNFLTSSIVDAVAYVFDRADALDVPAVVNLSLGHHYGPHDGTESTDRALDRLVGPGRIIVAAAGNEQEEPIHAEVAVGTGASEVVTLDLPSYTPAPGASNDYIRIDGYYTHGEIVNVSIQSPSGTLFGPVTAGHDATFATAEGTILVENDVYDPVTEDANLFIQLYDGNAGAPPASGTWTLHFHHVSGGAARHPAATAQVDLWMYSHTLNSAPAFVTGRTAAKLIASPATADSVIAVAAYVTKRSWSSVDGNTYSYSPAPVLGTLAPFSSNGPRRDGVSKPDIAAPGMGIVAALSGRAAVSSVWIAPDGVHMLSQGTSMATPHVAGVVALMLEAHGPLSKTQILKRLRETARSDDATGLVPNPGWGAGRIDALGATANPTPVLLSGLSVVRDATRVRLEWSVPGSTGDLFFRVARRAGDRPEEIVATVGPGPDFAFVDLEPGDAESIAYWLIPLDSGQETGRYGPFLAEWTGTRPSFSLSRPAPHPFIAEVRWTLSLPANGQVRLDIIDAAGRRVRTLLDGSLPAGTHALSWSGETDRSESASSGVYWVRARWNGQQVTERVLRLRG